MAVDHLLKAEAEFLLEDDAARALARIAEQARAIYLYREAGSPAPSPASPSRPARRDGVGRGSTPLAPPCGRISADGACGTVIPV